MQPQMRQPQPHIPPSAATAAMSAALDQQRLKKHRGSYNCGRCGLPKKGHMCYLTPTAASTPSAFPASSSHSAVRPPQAPRREPQAHLRRALSFDEGDVRLDAMEEPDLEPPLADLDLDLDLEICSSGLPAGCLWEVLRRLPPSGLLAAARVCKGWREMTRRMWRAVEELRLRVPAMAQIRNVGSLLQKCPGLLRLSLWMESDLDATMLACIAFSCPNLVVLEISISDKAVNRITGDELGRFVSDKRRLTSLKMEGCSNLGGFILCASGLYKLWLSDLYSFSKMAFNCSNLTEISLEFSSQEFDSSDLTTMVDGMGRSCPWLQSIHIASARLSHNVVLALTAADFRGLRMLSLVLGAEITDASVAAIASSYPNLEVLDLSGSSITDSGIGMICNAFPDTLSKLLLALCPNITASGIQFATAQLPLLELMDCGMTISDPNSQNLTSNESNDAEVHKTLTNMYPTYQKLFIKHNQLKKLSLWGCSSLDALYLNCPELSDLNLNSCNNLHPERLLLQCPGLETVHASGCPDPLIQAIQRQVSDNISPIEDHFPNKRLADGSKRVLAPNFLYQQAPDDRKKQSRIISRQCNVTVD